MTKTKLFLLGLFTLLVFPLLSFILNYFTSEQSFSVLFFSQTSLIIEVIVGAILGVLIAWIGWGILNLNYLKGELDKYSNLFSAQNLTYPLIIFVSLSAGIGEEIFFRGIIQPFLGVVLTAIFFVAIHGYLNPKNLKISIYGSYMVIVITLIGYLSNYLGLISAITAHTFIDIVLLIKTKKSLEAA